MIRYYKEYHDNVRTSVRRIELYTDYEVYKELTKAVDLIIDNKTNLNDSELSESAFIDSLINLSKYVDDNYQYIPEHTYDDLTEVIYSGIHTQIYRLLEKVHRVNCGDYDLIKEVDNND